MENVLQIGERRFEGRHERALLDRDKAESDNHRRRENRQRADLRSRPIQVNVRIVAATHRDLEMDVHEAAGGEARNGFTRVATMLALMDDEPDFYKPYDVGPEPDDDVDE